MEEKKDNKSTVRSTESGRNMILYAVFALLFGIFLIDLLAHTIGLV